MEGLIAVRRCDMVTLALERACAVQSYCGILPASINRHPCPLLKWRIDTCNCQAEFVRLNKAKSHQNITAAASCTLQMQLSVARSSYCDLSVVSNEDLESKEHLA